MLLSKLGALLVPYSVILIVLVALLLFTLKVTKEEVQMRKLAGISAVLIALAIVAVAMQIYKLF
jgi:hypothetical protein